MIATRREQRMKYRNDFLSNELILILIASKISRMMREFSVEYDYGPLKYKTSIILSPDEDLKFKFIDV